jgi:hypothetical protein
VVNNTDHQAVLQLVNLVAGRYTFTLTVTDEQGLSSKDTTSLLVKQGNRFIPYPIEPLSPSLFPHKKMKWGVCV